MPSVRSSRAPHFLGDKGELISGFLHEYDGLADGFGLTEEQMPAAGGDLVLHSAHHRHLCITLPGHQNGDRDDFQAHLEVIHPDVTESSRNSQVRCVFVTRPRFFRNFLIIAAPLLANRRITIDRYNTTFFRESYSIMHDILLNTLTESITHISWSMSHFLSKSSWKWHVVTSTQTTFTGEPSHRKEGPRQLLWPLKPP